MNRKGFTLIELLMVIVLIGIIALILVPNIITLVNKNNEKSCKSFKDNVISSTKMYVVENKYDLGFDCGTDKTKYITLKSLVDAGKLSEPVTDPKTKKKIENLDVISVKVIYDCNRKNFIYDDAFYNKNTKEKIELDCEKE